MLDLFDGGWGLKPPKTLLESATVINFKLNLFIVDCQVLVWGYSVDINYDRGDNLPHDQIRCHVTEAKINTVLITNAICKRQKKYICDR